MAGGEQSRLGCGRMIDDVWARADAPPDTHELTCQHCRRARASLLKLSEATDALIDHEEESPDYTPGRQVKDLVMKIVHVEVRRGESLPLLNPVEPETSPSLTISRQAVLDVIWRAADELPGVRARHCAVHLDPAQQPGQRAAVQLEVHIAVAAGLSIPQATEVLRAQLRERISLETGLATTRTTVTVEDLYDA